MHWSEQVFRYCERGHETGLFAEPFNAASNAAFLLVSMLAALRLARVGGSAGAARPVAWVLIALVALIGIGSFLFHVLATRWAQLADVVPIAAFMLLYLGFALRFLLGLAWPAVALGLAALIGALGMAIHLCPPEEAPLSSACLNGTVAYAPALLAMAAVGIALQRRGHWAAGQVLAAAGLFLVSMTMRSVDMAACETTRLGAHPVGLHVLWHLFNAATLYLLLMVAVRAVPRCQPRRDAA